MNYKFLLILLFLCALSMQTIAEDGHGYRIVSEKFISTPDANGYLVTTSPDNVPIIIQENEIKAHAFAQNQLGCPKTFNSVQGFHEVKMRNETNHIMLFKYIYSLSVEDAKNYFERNIELDPKGYYHDSSLDYLAFQRPGIEKRYEILVDTKITGEGNASSSYIGYLNLWFRLCK